MTSSIAEKWESIENGYVRLRWPDYCVSCLHHQRHWILPPGVNLFTTRQWFNCTSMNVYKSFLHPSWPCPIKRILYIDFHSSPNSQSTIIEGRFSASIIYVICRTLCSSWPALHLSMRVFGQQSAIYVAYSCAFFVGHTHKILNICDLDSGSFWSLIMSKYSCIMYVLCPALMT